MSLALLSPFDFYYVLFVIFLMGACIGSFTNVVILRAFTGESIVLPPSKCPHCKNKLKWYHNIPILSYLFLRGKCGFCKEKISIQYPLVELLVAILSVATFLKYDLTINSFILSIVCVLCVVLAVTDIKERVIFDGHAYILGGIGLVYNFFDIGKSGLGVYNLSILSQDITINKSFIFSILGLIAGALIMEILALSGKLLVGQRAFGEGDSFIMGAFGAVFRLQSVVPILVIGVIVQLILVLPVFIKNLIQRKEFKLLISLVCFLISVGLFKVFDVLKLLDNIFVLMFAFLLMCFFAVVSCKKLVQSAKNPQDLTIVPFGPPLVIAALYLMFI